MSTLTQISNFLEQKYPTSIQEEWDRSGIYFLPKNQKNVTGVIVCLDINEDTVKTALVHNCNLIVSHHPLSLKNTKQTKKEKKIYQIIRKNKIGIISHHTNFDKNKSGMNIILAKKMGLKFCKPLIKNDYLILISEVKPTTTKKLCLSLNKKFPFNKFYFSKNFTNKKVSKICITAGSGFSAFKSHLKKLEKNVDAYITGDLKWHDWQFAKNHHLNVIDAGHDIENIFIDHYSSILKQEFKGIRLIKMYNFSDLELV